MRINMEVTDQWLIVSIGNGAAYEITHKPTGREGFVQYGDDATQFRAEYDAMERMHCVEESVWYERNWNDCLAEVCEPYFVFNKGHYL